MGRIVTGRRAGWGIAAVGVIVAFGSKPTIVALGPVVLVVAGALRLTTTDAERRSLATRLLVAGGAVTAASVAYAVAVRQMHAAFGGERTVLPIGEHVVGAFALQAEHVLVPLGLRIHYSAHPPGFREYVIALAASVAVVALFVWAWKRGRVAIVGGLAWSVCTYAPYSGILGQSRYMADSYMYVPLIGLVVAAAGLLASAGPPALRRFQIGAVAIGALFAVLSFAEITDWREGGVRLWAEARAAEPWQPLYGLKLGQALYFQGEYAEAVEAFESVETGHYGRFFSFPSTWPMAYCELGDVERCEALLIEGIRRMRSRADESMSVAGDYQQLLEGYRHFRERYERPIEPSIRDAVEAEGAP